MNQLNLRTIVRGAYDIQKLRIQTGNRIVGNFKAKLGQEPSHKEEEIDAEGKAILTELRAAYAKLTDGVSRFPRQATFKGNEVISDYTELCLLAQYFELEKHEKQHFARLGKILKEYPIFTEFLDGVNGIGPAMAGVIISEIDIAKARYPSSLWAYAGLDVANGTGRSRRKEHLREVEYTNAKGESATRIGITFNPLLKSKLMGVLAGSFLKCVEWNDVEQAEYDALPETMRRLHKKTGMTQEKTITSPYAIAYYDYRHRMENHATYGAHNDKAEDDKGKRITSKLRRHNMAMRYMIKRFLVDLYKVWRELAKLPVAPEYSEAKLGLKHSEEAA